MSTHRIRRRKPRGRRRTFQPELLEPRQLLAADPIVVDLDHLRDSEDPNGEFTSLREAIALADANPGPDTITFAPNLNFGTITATGGELVINSEVTIDASSTGLLRIGRQRGSVADHRIFRISAGANVVMNNVIVQGGTAEFHHSGRNFGAGIYNAGTLQLTNSIVGGNIQFSRFSDSRTQRITELGGGAGIFNTASGNLTLENSHVGYLQIDDNVLRDLGLDPMDYREGNRPFELVPNNQAQGVGSGILNWGQLSVTVDSSVSGNRANHLGAGIYNAGAITISDSHVDNNRVGGGNIDGGGIYNSHQFRQHQASSQTGSSTISVRNCGWPRFDSLSNPFEGPQSRARYFGAGNS